MKAINRNHTTFLLLLCSFFLQTTFGLAQSNDSLNRVPAVKLMLESEVDTSSTLKADSLISLTIHSDSSILSKESNKSTMYSKVSGRSAEGYFGLKKRKGIRAWHYNSTFNLYNEQAVDTLLFLNHLNYPQQKSIETYTYLGTIGSPTQNDHFFSRGIGFPFLFSNAYSSYFSRSNEYSLFKTSTPYTLISFSNAGRKKEAEEMLSAFHTQNANDYLNFGVEYKFFGAKGVYQNQQTRSNNFAIFGNYCRGNFFVSSNFIYSTFKNKENGGIVDHSSIEDEVIEPALVPVFLNESTKSYSESLYRGINSTLGYTLLNFSRKELTSSGKDTLVFTPLVSTFVHYNYELHSRLYLYQHEAEAPDFYSNYYINPRSTRDSSSLYSHNFLAEVQFNQPFRYVGTPGLKAFAGINYLNYYSFKPTDFLYKNDGLQYNTSQIGVTAFSTSSYLTYRATLRAFLSGHRANDKELLGEITLSPWKRPGMPTVIGNIMIVEKEPDVFIKGFFSNHYKWENDFGKERRFLLRGKLKIEKLQTELSYNVLYINNYTFFDTSSVPAQQSSIAITSASVQNTLKIKGFNAISKVVWQVNSNTNVLSLPQVTAFSSLFYETVLVPNALTAQFGVSAFYRTKFYADAYNPAIGQFYLQKDKLIGNYPLVDAFVNLKWKRAIIFLKYEHVNQGLISNEYFATYRYPMNPRVFKYGISWMFYD